MTRLKFKKHRIERTCTKKYSDYHRYKPSLQKDFGGHCAYCNLNEEWVAPLPFEVDHFIPRGSFEAAGRDDLDTDYRNLMLSCPRCNRLKGNRFAGDIPDYEIYNPYFYNPVETDYNMIFYRDEKGRIHSDDELGQQMIEMLRLYRPSRQMAWLLDELRGVLERIEERLSRETNPKRVEILKNAKINLESALYKRHRIFVHSYMNEKGKKKCPKFP